MMKLKNCYKLSIVGATLLWLVVARNLSAAQYTVTDLGTLGHMTSTAYGINNLGEVIGESGSLAFLWLPSPAYGLPAGMNWPIMYDSKASAINDTGQVVGTYDEGPWRMPFLWENGVTTFLGTFGFGGEVNGINNFEQMVGSCALWDLAEPPEWYVRAFLWTRGVMIDLGTLGSKSSTAGAINDSGQVVGSAGLADNTSSLFLITPEDTDGDNISDLWYRDDDMDGKNDLMSELYPVPGTARDINDLGQVVGEACFYIHNSAFLWLPEPAYGLSAGMFVLGVPGQLGATAHAINYWGQVVGEGYHDIGAFIWDSLNGVRGLNDLIDSQSGWTLISAKDINDLGQIVGSGLNPQGIIHAFLLTPIHEPYCGDPDHLYSIADLNQDCMVDWADFSIFASHWLECTAPECD